MRWLTFAIAVLITAAAHAQFGESLNVERYLVDVRVTDANGNPITDLSASELTIRIGGKPAIVESIEWVDDTPTLEDDEDSDAPPRPLNDGRLILVFVQTDFARNEVRTRGQLNFLRYADKMIAALDPADRVAIFQFDSHLKFRLDFTADKDAVRHELKQTYRIENVPPPPAVPSPSLAPHLDRAAMKRAWTSEAGLLHIGRALRNIPGTKTLLLLGWGLGVRNANGVHMRNEYAPAVYALEAARTSIFSLDTTYADYHDLQIGLALAAANTGGFYAKTHMFPQLAVDRLRRTLAGHYELELRRPDALKPGTHVLDIRVGRRRAYVLAPSTVMDRK